MIRKLLIRSPFVMTTLALVACVGGGDAIVENDPATSVDGGSALPPPITDASAPVFPPGDGGGGGVDSGAPASAFYGACLSELALG